MTVNYVGVHESCNIDTLWLLIINDIAQHYTWVSALHISLSNEVWILICSLVCGHSYHLQECFIVCFCVVDEFYMYIKFLLVTYLLVNSRAHLYEQEADIGSGVPG